MCAREGENERQNAFARGMSNRFPVSKYTHLGANFDAHESNNFVEDACTTSNAVLLQCCGTCKAKRRSCDPFALTAKTDGSVLERNRAAESDDPSTSVPSTGQTFPSTPSQSAFERSYKRASSPAASLHWSQKNGVADDEAAGRWCVCQFLPHRSHRTSQEVPSSTRVTWYRCVRVNHMFAVVTIIELSVRSWFFKMLWRLTKMKLLEARC